MGLIKVTDSQGGAQFFDANSYAPYDPDAAVTLHVSDVQLQGAKALYEVCGDSKVQAVKVIRCFCPMGLGEAVRLYELAKAERGRAKY